MSQPQEEPLEKVRRAIGFAAEKHLGQTRKNNRTPYVAHPLRIFARLAVELNVKDEDILCAGILHDTIEDTKTDYDDLLESFGPRVADFVVALTQDKRLGEAARDVAFSKQLAAAPWEVRVVKLCDILDNTLDSKELPAERRKSYLARKREEVEHIAHDLPDWAQPLLAKLRTALSR